MSTDKTVAAGVPSGMTEMLSDGFVILASVESCMTAWRSLPDSVKAFLILSRVGPVCVWAAVMEHSLSRLSALEAQHSFIGRLLAAGGLDMTIAGSDT